MGLAYSIDPVDLVAMGVVILIYGLAFAVFFLVERVRQHKLQEAHRNRLNQLRGGPMNH